MFIFILNWLIAFKTYIYSLFQSTTDQKKKIESIIESLPTKPLIFICGPIGSGKSTLAAYMTTTLGWIEYSFAAPLKQIAEVFEFEYEELYGSQEQKLRPNAFWGVSGREFLQKFGTEICRDSLPKYVPQMDQIWIKLMQKKIQNDSSSGIVVSDCRFPDEAELCKTLGGYIIKVSRERGQLLFNDHRSENYHNIIENVWIINDSTIDELQIKLLTYICNIVLGDKKYSNHLANRDMKLLENFIHKAS